MSLLKTIIFLLLLAKPVKIDDLAKKMIKLSGLKVLNDDNPDGDIEITYTGLRPGEKLFEELLVGDNVTKTENKLIMRAREEKLDWDFLKPILIELEEASLMSDELKVRELLIKIVPNFKPQFKLDG